MVLPILPGGNAQAALPGVDEAQAAAEEELRRQQEEAIRQHEQYRQQLEMAQQQVQAKQGDLDLGQRLLQATDPNVPKAARNFLFAEISQRVGVDPKGDYSKQVQKMFTGLDPQSLEALRTTFSAQLKDAPPGQVNETVKAIMNGQMSGSDLLSMVQNAALQQGTYQAAQSPTTVGSQQSRPMPPAVAAVGGGGGGGGGALTGSEGQATLAGGPAQDRLLRGDLPAPIPAPREVTVESGEPTQADVEAQRASKPQLKGVEESQQAVPKRAFELMRRNPDQTDLSYEEFNKRYKTNITAEGGEKGTAAKLDTFKQKEQATGSTISLLSELHEMTDSASSVGWGASLATFLQNRKGDINGLAEYFKNARKDPSDTTSEGEVDKAAAATAKRLLGPNADATRVAQYQSLLSQLSYANAKDTGQTGQGYSNQDRIQFLNQLGASGDAAVNQKLIEDMIRRKYEGLSTEGNALLGAAGAYKPTFADLSMDQLKNIADRANDVNVARAAGESMVAKRRGLETQKEEVKPDTQLESRREQRRTELAGEEAKKRQEAQRREQAGVKETYETKRQARADELQATIAQATAEHQRTQEEHSAAALAETKRAHAAAEERQRRKDIQEVFHNMGVQIAKAFGGSIHFPQINLGGGEQDASAFVYRRPERRTPPKVK